MATLTAFRSAGSDLSGAQREATAYRLIFWGLLLAFEVFLFTLPLFPSGDGPVHIYLSSVFWKVATHRSPLYEHFYAIRHLVQPYSFHYYLLILLEHGMSADAAEKVFVGLIWATLALGFRTLAQALAPEPGASAASLLVFPLLFCWPVSAGFFNYTFACGLLLFALAFYTRLASSAKPLLPLGAFLVTLGLLVLAHPIPILVLICLLGLDLCFQSLAGWQTRRIIRLPPWQTAALGLACLSFVFPVLIADKAAVAGSVVGLHFHLDYVLPMLLGSTVSFFRAGNVLGGLYQALIALMLPVSARLFVREGLFRRLRGGSLREADRLLLGTLIFLAATLLFPDTMNGSALFAVRMWFLMWLLAAVCVAAVARTRSLQRAVASFGAAMALLCLLFAALYLRPVARQQAELERAPLPPHARGLFLQPENAMSGVRTHTWWALSYWDGVRAFAAHDDVLLNTPWLQLTIVPVAENGRAGLMRDLTPNLYSESPSLAMESLNRHPAEKLAALAQADFLLVADPNSPAPDPLRLAAEFVSARAAPWRCARHDFYAVCTRR